MQEEIGLRFWVGQEDRNAVVRSRESAFGAVVLHLAALVMLLISPRDAQALSFLSLSQATPVEVVELVPLVDLGPIFAPPPSVTPEQAPVPQEATPDDLTEEERRRHVIRTPGAPDRGPGNFTPPPAKERSGEGGSPDSAESLAPGTDPGDSGDEVETVEGNPEGWEKNGEVALLDIPRPPDGTDGMSAFFEERAPNLALQDSLKKGPADSKGGRVAPGPNETIGDASLRYPTIAIISDTRGVDFGPYLARLQNLTYPIFRSTLPDSFWIGDRGIVVAEFTILKDGTLKPGDPVIVRSSGKPHFDQHVLAVLKAAQTYPPFPAAFTGDFVTYRAVAYYNIPPEAVSP